MQRLWHLFSDVKAKKFLFVFLLCLAMFAMGNVVGVKQVKAYGADQCSGICSIVSNFGVGVCSPVCSVVAGDVTRTSQSNCITDCMQSWGESNQSVCIAVCGASTAVKKNDCSNACTAVANISGPQQCTSACLSGSSSGGGTGNDVTPPAGWRSQLQVTYNGVWKTIRSFYAIEDMQTATAECMAEMTQRTSSATVGYHVDPNNIKCSACSTANPSGCAPDTNEPVPAQPSAGTTGGNNGGGGGGTPVTAGTIASFPQIPPGEPDGSCGWLDVWCWTKFILAKLGEIWLRIIGYITWIVGWVFDMSLSYLLNYPVGNIEAVKIGWMIVRDVLNMFFIFTLLYIAIQMVLGLSGGKMSTVANLIIAALLINFSMMITRVIMDASNVFALEFYHAMGGGTSSASISGTIMNGLKVQNMFNSNVSGGMGGSALAPGQAISLMSIIWTSVLGTFLYFCVMGVMISGIALFLRRFFVFMMLLLTSPVAFGGMIFPSLKAASKEWWNNMTESALVAPVYLFCLYLVVQIMNGNIFANSMSGYFNSRSDWGMNNLAGIQTLLNFLILIILLGGCYVMAQKVGGDVAKEGLKWGDKAKGWAKSKGVRAIGAAAKSWSEGEGWRKATERIPLIGKKVSSWIPKSAIEKKEDEIAGIKSKMTTPAAAAGYYHRLKKAEAELVQAKKEKAPRARSFLWRETIGRVGNMGKGYLMKQAAALGKANDKLYEEERKDFGDMTSDAKENLLKSIQPTTTNQKTINALVADLAKDGELKTYDEADPAFGELHTRLNKMIKDARNNLDNQMVGALVKEVDAMRPDIVVEKLLGDLLKEEELGAVADPKKIKKLTGKIRGKLKKAKFGSFKGETIGQLLNSGSTVPGLKDALIAYTMGAMPSSGAQQIFEEGSDDVQNVFRSQVDDLIKEAGKETPYINRAMTLTKKSRERIESGDILAAQLDVKTKPLTEAEMIVTADDVADLLRKPESRGGKYNNPNLASWFTGQGRNLLGLPKREGKKKNK